MFDIDIDIGTLRREMISKFWTSLEYNNNRSNHESKTKMTVSMQVIATTEKSRRQKHIVAFTNALTRS